MAGKVTGLSRDLISHPGETLFDLINDRGMKQCELAARTQVSEPFISGIISGKQNISMSFAKKLEYVFGVESSFWTNLQAIYDRQILEFEEQNNINEDEFSVMKSLSEIISYLKEKGIIEKGPNKANTIIDMRKFLEISSLTAIPSVMLNGAYRGTENVNIDIYVMFAWQKLCEIKTQTIDVRNKLDKDMLRSRIPQIKAMMFLPIEELQDNLTKVFAECGIAFSIVRNFKGAPVQGFISKSSDGKVSLCITIRQKFADVFWFTLFHEIAHILNDDYSKKKIDYTFIKDENEIEADKAARNFLINDHAYDSFVERNNFSLSEIKEFADLQNVKSYILIGRLQKDKLLGYNMFYNEKVKYSWVN